MTDLLIYENNGDGGDILQQGNNLAVVHGVENQPYLALFGGAPDGSAWWADKVFFPGTPSRHFLSHTQKTLNTVAINSNGRIAIEEAVKKDLAYLSSMVPGTQVLVSVVIENDDRLAININLNGRLIIFYWYYNRQVLAGPTIQRSGVGYDIVESTLIVY